MISRKYFRGGGKPAFPITVSPYFFVLLFESGFLAGILSVRECFKVVVLEVQSELLCGWNFAVMLSINESYNNYRA